MVTISTRDFVLRLRLCRPFLPAKRALVLSVCLLVLGRTAVAGDLPDPVKLRLIEINREEIFEPDQDHFRFVPRVINRLHWLTRESVVHRQVWLRPGDTVSRADVEELERNLRKLDLFSDVSVAIRAVPGNPTFADLVINTRDRLSLVLSGGGSFLGGVGEVQFSVGDRNLFGTGHRLTFGYAESTNGELRGSVAYDNVLIASNDVFGELRLGQTEEGSFSSVKIDNRFLNFQDNTAWSIDLSNDERQIDYYEQGESIAEVPRIINRLELVGQRRTGENTSLWRYGPTAAYRDIQYGAATGPSAAKIIVPPDAEKMFVGGLLAYDAYHLYKKVKWLDTLSYQQDLSLGFSTELQMGFEQSRTSEESATLPLVTFNISSAHEIVPHNYLNTSLKSFGGFDGTDLSLWSLELEASWFNTRFANQTLAVNLLYKSASNNDSGLPVQQSLGENNGLRGYPAREFNGEQLVLLNVEDRVRTSLSIASFRLGVIGFFDTGWVGDRDTGLENSRSSAGIGLRIGSRAILGSGVVRVDLAFPLDDDPARDYQPTFSLALGQVFDFNR